MCWRLPWEQVVLWVDHPCFCKLGVGALLCSLHLSKLRKGSLLRDWAPTSILWNYPNSRIWTSIDSGIIWGSNQEISQRGVRFCREESRASVIRHWLHMGGQHWKRGGQSEWENVLHILPFKIECGESGAWFSQCGYQLEAVIWERLWTHIS